MTVYNDVQKIINGIFNKGLNDKGVALQFQFELIMMQKYYEKYIADLKVSHESQIEAVKSQINSENASKYNVIIEQLKSQHKLEIVKLNYEKEEALKALAQQLAMESKAKYEAIIKQNNIQAESKINGLLQQLAELNAKFDDSQAIVAQKNALINEMEKTHKETLAENQKIIDACSSEVKSILNQADLKAQRNKKLALGGAGIIGAYLMMKD